MPPPAPARPAAGAPSFRQAFLFWLKLGLISFGGPAGQIAIMHQELVEKRKWISEASFLHALNFCMLLPGPEAQQLATYIGWRLHRTLGGLVAGTLFVLPSALLLWLLSWLYLLYGQTGWLSSILHGLNAAVIAIVALAVIRIGKKILKNPVMWVLAAGAFVSLYFFTAPFPAVIVGAGLIGFFGGRAGPDYFAGPGHGTAAAEAGLEAADPRPPTLARNLKILGLGLTLWLAPVVALLFWRGDEDVLFQQGVFFSKAALVTFGGAYAVLPYVAQQAVETFAWLNPAQMLSGLALAETTPGPLIMVLQFVGFVGGWNHAGSDSPLLIATLGSLITAWVTFVPCFLWIFLGAPYMERLQGNPMLSAALSAITAAVVGVILNLALWFARHTLWPASGSFDLFAAVLALAAGMALWRCKIGVIPVILVSGLFGWLWHFVT